MNSRPFRLNDALNVIVDKLFVFYGPVPQLAVSLIDRIVELPDTQPIRDMLCSILHEHKEFEQCGKLIPQQQMRYRINTHSLFLVYLLLWNLHYDIILSVLQIIWYSLWLLRLYDHSTSPNPMMFSSKACLLMIVILFFTI